MKPTKFIYIILLALLTFFSSVEFCKHSSEFRNYHLTQDVLSACDIPQMESSSESISNDLKARFTVKKKAKTRVEESENRIFKRNYYTSFIDFEVLKNGVIYGVANIYKIQQHKHLHLYHLF